MELIIAIVGYVLLVAAVVFGILRSMRRKRRKAWQAYYDDPRPGRSRPTRRRR
jgi:hypothetical protein